MSLSVRRRSGEWRFWYVARWMVPLTVALAACGGSSKDDDDDDGGAGGEDNAGTGGTSGKGGTGGSATGGTAAAGKGGTGASAGRGGTGGTGGSNTSGSGGTGMPTHIGDCDEFTPCGGDPTGTWRVTETCMEVTFAMLPAGCENMIRDFDVDMVGTYTLESGVIESDIAMHSAVTLVLDDTCAAAFSGLPLTAEVLCPLLADEAGSDPETTMTCDFDGTDCVCLQTQMPPAERNTESYQVSGNQLINGQGETVDFCTEGDSLLLQSSRVPDDISIVSDIKLVLELTRE